MGWSADVSLGTSAVVAVVLLVCGGLGVTAYRRGLTPASRARLRWVGGGAVGTAVIGVAGWHLPLVLTGAPLLPAGALGLSGLPFLVGVGVALRRHRLFDIEHLANRSLTYLALTAVLVSGYAVLVAAFGAVLGLSGGAAAALAAAVAAVALAPALRLARRGVNRLMYGDRDDPAGVLARLGRRMQATLLPDDVLPAVVETVGSSLRLPYVAIDVAESTSGPTGGPVRRGVRSGRGVGTGRGRRTGLPGGGRARHPAGGPAHRAAHPPRQHGRSAARVGPGPDDPLGPADVSLLASLAAEVGPAVQAVRLHQDLLRSRAEVVVLRGGGATAAPS